MQFKTKDLLVTVLPKLEDAEIAKVCLFHTFICKHPTIVNCLHQTCILNTYTGCGRCSLFITCGYCSHFQTFCNACSLLVSCIGCSVAVSAGCHFGNSCGAGGSACDPTIFCGISNDPFVIEHLEDLITLRAELQDTLKRLDAMQKEGLSSGIGTKAEAEAIEKGLNEALEQVRAAKKGTK